MLNEQNESLEDFQDIMRQIQRMMLPTAGQIQAAEKHIESLQSIEEFDQPAEMMIKGPAAEHLPKDQRLDKQDWYSLPQDQRNWVNADQCSAGLVAAGLFHDAGAHTQTGTGPDNRTLTFAIDAGLVLLGVMHPAIHSLRDLQRASELKPVRKALTPPGASTAVRTSMGSLPESVRVFDPELLQPIIAELAGRLPKNLHHGNTPQPEATVSSVPLPPKTA